ncbi:MAG: Ig-like domain-containing protein, partial [Thiohalorhabdus sp.]
MPKSRLISRSVGPVLLGLAFVLPAVGVTIASSGASGASGSNSNPNALWAAQSHGVLKLGAADGRVLVELPDRGVRALVADPRRGTIWALRRGKLVSYHPDGGPRTVTRLDREEDPAGAVRPAGGNRLTGMRQGRGGPGGPGHDERDAEDEGEKGKEGHGVEGRHEAGEGHRKARLAVDATGAVWLVREATLLRVGRDGTVQWRTALEDDPEALAIDTQRDRLWLAQGETLVAIASNGTRAARIDLADRGDVEFEALAYAPSLDALWVAGDDHLLRLGPDGTRQLREAIEDAGHLAADGQGGLWLAGERTLRHVAAAGLVRFELRPLARQGKLVDLAANPADGAVWVASPQGLARVAHSGSVTHRKAFRGPGHTGRVWALSLFADVTSPTLTFEAPGPDSVHASLTPELRLAHRDLGSGVAPDTLAVSVDGDSVAVACDHGEGTSTCTAEPPLPEGRITLAATVADHAGNTSEAAEVTVTLDVTPPVITVSEPEEGAYTNRSELTLTGRVTDNASGVAEFTVADAPVDLGPDHGFAHTVTLSEDGTHRFGLAATDRAGNRATLTRTVIRDTVPPAAPATGKIEVEVRGGTATVTGAKGSVEAHATVVVTNTRTGETVRAAADGEGRFTAEIAAQAGDRLRVAAVDRAGNESDSAEIATSDIPPDSSQMAPPMPESGMPPFAQRVAFLHRGPNPIQEGVGAGTIEARRVAVLRGEVANRAGEPMPGVTVSVLNHPEFGQTRTQADGGFDLAANGGGQLTLVYRKEGFLTVQRTVDTGWNDWYRVDEVVLTPLSDKVTRIDLTSDRPMQVAAGPEVTDQAGARQAVVMVPQGTTASMKRPDGTTEQLAKLDLRLTEYTVGPEGPRAMPAELPPSTGYTYAVELSTDQFRERGVAEGGKEVRFNQPVSVYVDNFLGFPTGGAVPVGYYNRDTANWVAEENGRVIEVLGKSGGLARLDVTGDGSPATAEERNELGITDPERARLANRYEPGDTLWRVTTTHLSTWDWNWGYGPPSGARGPSFQVDPEADQAGETSEQNDCPGCSISPQDQAVSESIEVPGTGLSLHYNSDRAAGAADTTTEIPVMGSSVPEDLRYVKVEIDIAGQRIRRRFADPHPDQRFTFTWDGRDGFGRKWYGEAKAYIRVAYHYGCVYRRPQRESGGGGGGGGTASLRSFGQPSQTTTTPTGVAFKALGASGEGRCRGFDFTKEWKASLESPHRPRQGAGNWSLSADHTLRDGVLFRGDGSRRKLDARIIETVAGTGQAGFGGDGGPADRAQLFNPRGVASGPDGSLYIADHGNDRIRRVSPDGTITTVAGKRRNRPLGDNDIGDGGPATEALFTSPRGVAVGADGSMYIADYRRVRKVDPDGLITTVAGTGEKGFSGDGGPATQAQFRQLKDVAVGPDGGLYIADTRNERIRKVASDGTITTVAGGGSTRPLDADGRPATAVDLRKPQAIAVGPDGSLFLAEAGYRIRRVAPDGTIETLAGDDYGYGGDGGDPRDAFLKSPDGLALGQGTGLYIATNTGHRIRWIQPKGTITTVAGNGLRRIHAPFKEGGSPTEVPLSHPRDVAVGPSGNLYIAAPGDDRIFRVRAGGRMTTLDGKTAVPSRDGNRRYVFDDAGRILRSEDTRTGHTLRAFERDPVGRLTAITDGDGNTTTIERDAAGQATAIVAPDGQHTALTIDGNGHLTGLTEATGATWAMAYTGDGLLTEITDPGGDTSAFAYNGNGRLVRDHGPDGWLWDIARTRVADGYRVTMTSGEGHTSAFTTHRPLEGRRVYTNRAPDGTETRRTHTDGGDTTVERPDGTTVTRSEAPDPRFGMGAPVTEDATITTPSGLERTVQRGRSANVPDRAPAVRPVRLSRSVTVNGRRAEAVFEQATATWTLTTPAGRTAMRTIDGQGRTLALDPAGLAPMNAAYDNRGRPTEVTIASSTETRTTRLAYYGAGAGDQAGYLKSVTDPLGRVVTYTRDAAGRVTEQTLPDGGTVGYRYDAEGNLTAVIPPGRSAHVFTHNGRDNRASYTPPDLGGTKTITRYTYNRDQQLTSVERPGGGVVDITYDSGGRRSAVILPKFGTVTYGYDSHTGQLATILAPGGQNLSLAYDGFLPTRSQWAGTVSGTVTRDYDNNFWVTGRSVNGSQVGFAYDDDGLLTAAGALSLTRDPDHGRVTGTALAGITGSRSYNPFGELSGRTVQVSGAGVYDAGYARDKLGRITGETETVNGAPESWDYTYDDGGRLTRVTRDGSLVADYSYDANGNRTAVTTPSGTITADYDEQDRLIRYGSTTYGYTQAGDLRSQTGPAGTTTYDYDALGNLRHVELASGKTIDYVIDGRNRRIGKKVDGSLVQGFLYKDSLNPIAELDGSGNVEARFVYGAKPNVPAYMIRNGTEYRIISDHLG